MSLAPGSRIGPYLLVEQIGAGTTGEVFRAHDPRLGRDVALKVLRPAHGTVSEQQAWFEREARVLASLNHPHIATIYGFHETDGVSAFALELVDGETLSACLRRGPLPVHDAFKYALQITGALAYAHRRGLVHRDVKPGNIVVTTDGAKLLDFGLAHLIEPVRAPQSAVITDVSPGGTPFYMSPEQSAGVEVDQRSDIYSVGLVLCQMFTGFRPDSASGLSTRTLVRGLLQQIRSRPLRRVIARCLEPDRDDRWQHAADLHHALALVADADPALDLHSDAGDQPAGEARGPAGGWRPARLWGLAALLLVLLAGGAAFLMWRTDPEPPTFQQLTFRRGTVLSARFAGDAIVYSAAWDGAPAELWSMRPDNPESRRLGIVDARVMSVSPTGEMAVLLGRRVGAGGMLARLPLDASTPRDVLSSVDDADWSSDGQALAVAHISNGRSRLEFPIGVMLHETDGWLDGVRISPDDEYVAFVDHPLSYDDRGTVSVVARTGGAVRALSGPWPSVSGLAWAPDGGEIWFTAAEFGSSASLYAVDLSGRVRVLARSAHRMTIHDVHQNGRVLLTEGRYRLRIAALELPSGQARDLSWLDGSMLSDLSPDGRTLLINEVAAGAGTPLHAVYLRRIDSPSPIRLGEGATPALSPDGRWAATLLLPSPPSLILLPTGAGLARTMPRGPLVDYQTVTWFPDGTRVLIAGSEAGGAVRLWTQEVDNGVPMPIGPSGLRIAPYSRPISPDGTLVIATDPHGRTWLQPLAEHEEPRQIDTLTLGDTAIRWDERGESFYVFRQGDLPAVIDRVDINGRRERLAVLAPSDAAGVRTLASVQTTPDGRFFAYSYAQTLSDLFLVSHVR